MLTRYCLAYFLILDGDSVESTKLLDELEQTWVPRMPPDDAFVVSIRGMETCAKANAAAVTGDGIPEALDSLKQLFTQLRAQNFCVPIQRLAARTAAHLRNPQKPKPEDPKANGT